MSTKHSPQKPPSPDGLSLIRNDPGLYIIFNRHTGRTYIGLTASRRARCSKHLSDLRRGEHPNYKMQRDADLHGVDQFCFLPLMANIPEPTAIKAMKADDLELGYNLMDGRDWTAETKLRDCEFRLLKKKLYAYLPGIDRATPILRLFLDSWSKSTAINKS